MLERHLPMNVERRRNASTGLSRASRAIEMMWLFIIWRGKRPLATLGGALWNLVAGSRFELLIYGL